MNRVQSVIFLVLVLLSFNSKAQTPVHYVIGEQIFAGVQIYGIYQDVDLNYWIASDRGVYFYDGHDFKQFECSNMLSRSVFNLWGNNENSIFCNNLGGQIFKIQNDECELYYQVPDSLMTSNILIRVLFGDYLAMAGRGLHILTPDKKLIHFNDLSFFASDFSLQNRKMLKLTNYTGYPKPLYNEIIFNSKGYHFSQRELSFKGENKETNLSHSFKPIVNGKYFFDHEQSKVYIREKDTLYPIYSLAKTHFTHAALISDSIFWAFNSTLGISVINLADSTNTNKILFPNYRFSTHSTDHEGNLLLGTFNKGIVVIPKVDVENVALPLDLSNVSQITNDGKSVYISNYNGEIYNLTQQSYKLKNLKYPIEKMEYLKSEKCMVIGGNKSLIQYENFPPLTYRIGLIKDIYPLYNGELVVAANRSLTIIPTYETTTSFLSKPYDVYFNQTHHTLDRQRYYSVCYDSTSHSIYGGSASGLNIFKSDTSLKATVNGNQILSKDMIAYNGKVYVATENQGVIIFANDTINSQWTTRNFLPSNSVKKLAIHDRLLICATDQGILIIHTENQESYLLTQTNGLLNSQIMDLTVLNGVLWLLYPDGLQKLHLSNLTQNHFIPEVSINRVLMNDQSVGVSNDVKNFAYNQNRFAFDFDSKTLQYRNELNFQYRLVGVENEWQNTPYHEHTVIYKTLPPGEYRFEVQAVYRDAKSEVKTYSFTISPPFWGRWWFYLIILTLTLFSISFYLKQYFAKKLRKAAMQRELYESKLTAIQAQMNPHFIFNALNSIQDLIIKQHTEKAYNYVSKFAMLVRNTLNNSSVDYIDFSTEINSLELYLELEQLRFGSDFSYTIHAPEDVDLCIPPMLIQPFLENSLIHGLMHRKGEKKLHVLFNITEQMITCIIRDNGIGRKASSEIQQRQRANHESFAIKAIRKRLEILRQKHQGEFEVHYSDIIKNGEVAGTEVKLYLPYTEAF